MSDILLLYPAGGRSVNAEGPLFFAHRGGKAVFLAPERDFAIMQGSNRPLRAAGEGWDVQTDVSGDHQRVQSPVRLLPRYPAAPAVHDAGGIPAVGDPAAALRDVSHAPRHGEPLLHPPTGGAAGYRRGAGLSGVPCDQRHAASPAAAHTGGFPGPAQAQCLPPQLRGKRTAGCRRPVSGGCLAGGAAAQQPGRPVRPAAVERRRTGPAQRRDPVLSLGKAGPGRNGPAYGPSGQPAAGGGLFLEPGERFDWPDPAAPDSGTEFCHGLRSQIAVLCDGTVVPCCLDSEGRLALGNLHRQELAEILASPRATAMAAGFSRRQPSEELCRRCGYAARFSR